MNEDLDKLVTQYTQEGVTVLGEQKSVTNDKKGAYDSTDYYDNSNARGDGDK